MAHSDNTPLKVDVPVGFLLPEAREILVSVDRAASAPLSIRLRLVPAEVDGMTDLGASPHRTPDDTPLPTRRLSRRRESDGYPEHEIGGGD